MQDGIASLWSNDDRAHRACKGDMYPLRIHHSHHIQQISRVKGDSKRFPAVSLDFDLFRYLAEFGRGRREFDRLLIDGNQPHDIRSSLPVTTGRARSSASVNCFVSSVNSVLKTVGMILDVSGYVPSKIRNKEHVLHPEQNLVVLNHDIDHRVLRKDLAEFIASVFAGMTIGRRCSVHVLGSRLHCLPDDGGP